MDQDEETVTAWHEAGHATVAILYGGQIQHVSIEPPDDDGPRRYGETVVQWIDRNRHELAHAEVCVCLAGPVAEMIFLGQTYDFARVAEWRLDWESAHQAASTISNQPAKVFQHLNEAARQLHDWFSNAEIWAAVGDVADLLLAHQTVEHEEIAETVGFWHRQSGLEGL